MTRDQDRRIIEEYLPIHSISEEARGESSATQAKNILVKATLAKLHRWWARRPLTTSRAAVFGALVPVSFFRVDKGRESPVEILHATDFMKKLCVQNVSRDILEKAKGLIEDRYDRPARVLDLFAGGGSIPLEAARLGCEAYAIELNPVAHLVELATLDYPARYGQELVDLVRHWSGVVLERAREEVGDLYPPIPDPDAPAVEIAPEVQRELDHMPGRRQLSLAAPRGMLTPVAYLWTRTVPCPHCGATVPLHKQTWLRQKKKGFVALRPYLIREAKQVRYELLKSSADSAEDAIEEWGFDPTDISTAGETECLYCATTLSNDSIKRCGQGGQIGIAEMAVVATRPGRTGKVYSLPAGIETSAIDADKLCERIETLASEIGTVRHECSLPPRGALGFRVQPYGLVDWDQLFVPRQLASLLSFAKQIRKAYTEMIETGLDADLAKAVVTYLAFIVDKVAERNSAICRWHNGGEKVESPISAGKMPMVWDFPETNPFAGGSGSWESSSDDVVAALHELVNGGFEPVRCRRGSAMSLPFENGYFDAVVTDPPYYDSVPYANLADYFYVWLKRTVGDLYPEHFTGETSPRRQEAIMDKTLHHGSIILARQAYEDMMFKAFSEASRVLCPGGALVCVYAHKTTAGWATLIDALRRAGLTVTEAWPLDTESATRPRAQDSAALGASISIVARKREGNGIGQYESQVRPELEQIVRDRVTMLWDKGIGAADLIIAAVGAGLRAFTRFGSVEMANGETVPAEKFLSEVEGVVFDTLLEKIFNSPRSGVSAVDPETRFYVLWRYTYKTAEVDAEDAIVFAYSQHVELSQLAAAGHPLLSKKGKTYKALDFKERGDAERLGLPDSNGNPAPLIDVLHRALWLMENAPEAEFRRFMAASRPNRDRLRLVANALSGAALKGSQSEGARSAVTTPKEQAAVSVLAASWRSLMREEQPAQTALGL